MPRKRFVIAPDAARRIVDCKHYSLNGGAPRCAALTHPWCLAPGEAPGTCKFRAPKVTQAAAAPEDETQAAAAAEDETQGQIVLFDEDETGAIVDAAGAGESSPIEAETETEPAPEDPKPAAKPAGRRGKKTDGQAD